VPGEDDPATDQRIAGPASADHEQLQEDG